MQFLLLSCVHIQSHTYVSNSVSLPLQLPQDIEWQHVLQRSPDYFSLRYTHIRCREAYGKLVHEHFCRALRQLKSTPPSRQEFASIVYEIPKGTVWANWCIVMLIVLTPCVDFHMRILGGSSRIKLMHTNEKCINYHQLISTTSCCCCCSITGAVRKLFWRK